MKAITINTGLIIIIAGLMSTSAVSQNQNITAQYMSEFRDDMKFLVDNKPYRGAAISVFKDGQTWSTGYGIKTSGKDIDPEDRFIFRSFTKTLTATIILQLQEEGLVDINDKLTDYIDPVKNVDPGVTLIELLNMHAATCNFIQNSWAVIDEDPEAILDVREVLEETIPEGPCNLEKELSYNDTNYQLLGLVIEEVTGKKGEVVFRERLVAKEETESDTVLYPWIIADGILELAPIDVDPNSMNGLWVEENGTPINKFGESLNATLTAQKFAAGSVGTTEQMLRILIAILTPGQLLTQESIDLMTSFTDGNYGLGLMTFDVDDYFDEDMPGRMIGHIGAGLNTSGTFYFPDHGFGISIAVNMTRSNPIDVFNDMIYTLGYNFTYLNDCVKAGGCEDIAAPNPIKGSMVSYENNNWIFLSTPVEMEVAYENWDGESDTTIFLMDGGNVFDELGQGYSLLYFKSISEMEYSWYTDPFIWEPDSVFKDLYVNSIKVIEFEYDSIPNPVFGTIKSKIVDSKAGFEVTPTAIEKNESFFLKQRHPLFCKTTLIVNMNPVPAYHESLYQIPSSIVDSLESVLIGSSNNNQCINGIYSETPIYDIPAKIYDDSLNARRAMIHLPPKYYDDDSTNYSVVYFLHGSGGDQTEYEELPALMNEKMKSGEIRNMILVKPDGSAPLYGGSYYTNSELNGNVETMVAEVIPDEMSHSFRVDESTSCIMGFSMGGYGAMKIGLKYPEQFDCIVSHSGPLDLSPIRNMVPLVLQENGGSAPYEFNVEDGNLTYNAFTLAAAFSPNPEKESGVDFFIDENGELDEGVFQRWMEHNPPQFIEGFANSGVHTSIYFDVGVKDENGLLAFNDNFADSLDAFGVPYRYETFDGKHIDKLEERYEVSLAFIDSVFQSISPVGIETEPEMDRDVVEMFTLSQNYPNPFNPSTMIRFQLPVSSYVSLKVYDLLGREVANLVDERESSGSHSVRFDASGLASGIYIYRLSTGDQAITRKMILMK